MFFWHLKNKHVYDIFETPEKFDDSIFLVVRQKTSVETMPYMRLDRN